MTINSNLNSQIDNKNNVSEDSSLISLVQYFKNIVGNEILNKDGKKEIKDILKDGKTQNSEKIKYFEEQILGLNNILNLEREELNAYEKRKSSYEKLNLVTTDESEKSLKIKEKIKNIEYIIRSYESIISTLESENFILYNDLKEELSKNQKEIVLNNEKIKEFFERIEGYKQNLLSNERIITELNNQNFYEQKGEEILKSQLDLTNSSSLFISEQISLLENRIKSLELRNGLLEDINEKINRDLKLFITEYKDVLKELYGKNKNTLKKDKKTEEKIIFEEKILEENEKLDLEIEKSEIKANQKENFFDDKNYGIDYEVEENISKIEENKENLIFAQEIIIILKELLNKDNLLDEKDIEKIDELKTEFESIKKELPISIIEEISHSLENIDKMIVLEKEVKESVENIKDENTLKGIQELVLEEIGEPEDEYSQILREKYNNFFESRITKLTEGKINSTSRENDLITIHQKIDGIGDIEKSDLFNDKLEELYREQNFDGKKEGVLNFGDNLETIHLVREEEKNQDLYSSDSNLQEEYNESFDINLKELPKDGENYELNLKTYEAGKEDGLGWKKIAKNYIFSEFQSGEANGLTVIFSEFGDKRSEGIYEDGKMKSGVQYNTKGEIIRKV